MNNDKLFNAALYGEIVVLFGQACFYPIHRLAAGTAMVAVAIGLFIFRRKIKDRLVVDIEARALYLCLATAFLMLSGWILYFMTTQLANPYYRYGPHNHHGTFSLGDGAIAIWGVALLAIALPSRMAGWAWCVRESRDKMAGAEKTKMTIAVIAGIILWPALVFLGGTSVLLVFQILGRGYGFGFWI